MANNDKIIRITCILNKGTASLLLPKLRDIGIDILNLTTARSIILTEKKGFLGFKSGSVLQEEQVEILTILVFEKYELHLMNYIIKNANLSTPGMGTIYSEAIDANLLLEEEKINDLNFETGETYQLQTELIGISCIVQRSKGDEVAKVALDSGICVPVITFGTGTGLRDKLGIIRITIPYEKEIVNVFVSKSEADAVMNQMIDVGKLNQPGKGFIYMYPIRWGLINTKMFHGLVHHAANIEQIISAIDDVKGNTMWRSRASEDIQATHSKRTYLTGLKDLQLICNDGHSLDLIKKAMEVGAAGATVGKQKFVFLKDVKSSNILPARDISYMAISNPQIPTILDALKESISKDKKIAAHIESREIIKAFTYLGKE